MIVFMVNGYNIWAMISVNTERFATATETWAHRDGGRYCAGFHVGMRSCGNRNEECSRINSAVIEEDAKNGEELCG